MCDEEHRNDPAPSRSTLASKALAAAVLCLACLGAYPLGSEFSAAPPGVSEVAVLAIVGLVVGVALAWTGLSGKVGSRPAARAGGVLGLAAILAVGTVTWRREVAPSDRASNFSLSPLRQRLPALADCLHDGGWAAPDLERGLQAARRRYPAQARLIDRYLACWRFWAGDRAEGEAALWRLGQQVELAEFHARLGAWEAVERIAQGAYLPGVAETLPSARVAALEALARRSGAPGQDARATRLLLEAFQNSGRLEVTEQDRLWQRVARGAGSEISWTEYYRSLQALSLQSLTPEALGRIFFEMRKLEQLHPEVRRLAAEPAAGAGSPRQNL